jgi:hypothetical protein
MSEFQLLKPNLEMCKYHHGHCLAQDSVSRCELSTFAYRALQIITGF